MDPLEPELGNLYFFHFEKNQILNFSSSKIIFYPHQWNFGPQVTQEIATEKNVKFIFIFNFFLKIKRNYPLKKLVFWENWGPEEQGPVPRHLWLHLRAAPDWERTRFLREPRPPKSEARCLGTTDFTFTLSLIWSSPVYKISG